MSDVTTLADGTRFDWNVGGDSIEVTVNPFGRNRVVSQTRKIYERVEDPQTTLEWQTVVAAIVTNIDYRSGAGIILTGGQSIHDVLVPTNANGLARGILKIQGHATDPITYAQFSGWVFDGTFAAPKNAAKYLTLEYFYDEPNAAWHLMVPTVSAIPEIDTGSNDLATFGQIKIIRDAGGSVLEARTSTGETFIP